MASELWIEIDEFDVALARRLALARLVEVERQQSAHRPTARNQTAQFRGAAGELAARKWIVSNDLTVESGFEADRPRDSDLTVCGMRIEVMTAQVAHRQITGFCVPPGKLRAATRRGALGYVFIGTGAEAEPRRFLIQGFCELSNVGLSEPRQTRVSERSPSVLNHVVSPEHIKSPDYLIQHLMRYGGN